MTIIRFNPSAEYVPGKILIVADTQSHNLPVDMFVEMDTQRDVACYVANVIGGILASTNKIEEIRNNDGS